MKKFSSHFILEEKNKPTIIDSAGNVIQNGKEETYLFKSCFVKQTGEYQRRKERQKTKTKYKTNERERRKGK